MTTNSHHECSHPSTKRARAMCRKQRVAAELVQAASVDSCLDALGNWNRWYLIESATGYDDRVTQIDDYHAAHSNLIGMGYTCTRQAYSVHDNVNAAWFQHKTNDTMSARLELR